MKKEERMEEIIKLHNQIKNINKSIKIHKKKFTSDISGKVKQIRIKNKLSQEEFAASIGIKRTSVTNIEKGIQGLTIENLITMCLIYNISSDYILGLSK